MTFFSQSSYSILCAYVTFYRKPKREEGFQSICSSEGFSLIISNMSSFFLFPLNVLPLERVFEGGRRYMLVGDQNIKAHAHSSQHWGNPDSPLSSTLESFCQLLDATHCEQSPSVPQQLPCFLRLLLVESSVSKTENKTLAIIIFYWVQPA